MNKCNQCFAEIKYPETLKIHTCNGCGSNFLLVGIDDLGIPPPFQFSVGALPWYNSKGTGYSANGSHHPIDEFVEIDNVIYAAIPVQFYSDKKVFHATYLYTAFYIIENGLKTAHEARYQTHGVGLEANYKFVGLEVEPAAVHKKNDAPSVILEGRFTGWVINARKMSIPGTTIYQKYLIIHPEVKSLQFKESGDAMVSARSVNIVFSEEENRDILFKEIGQLSIREIFWFRRWVGIKAVLRLIYRSIRSSF